MKLMDKMNKYFSEAMARIFAPTDDEYPNTGVQPFEGVPTKKTKKYKSS